MNLDLVYGDIANIGDMATLLCVTGDRFKKLPSKDISEGNIVSFEYVQDKDGYVTKTTTIDKHSTYINEITYE